MTRDELLAEHQAFTGRMFEICKAKNHDYGGASGDPFANFTRVQALGVCSPEQGFLVRMTDKMSRIATLLTAEAQVKDESIDDTLLDLANYAFLLSAYRKNKLGRSVVWAREERVAAMRAKEAELKDFLSTVQELGGK